MLSTLKHTTHNSRIISNEFDNSISEYLILD